MMKKRLAALVVAAGVCAWGGTASAGDPKMPPDNTGINERDRSGHLTATDQSEKKEDLEISANIRKSVVGDDALSTNAHNVKIITIDGVVTLRGPVKTEQEKVAIASKAKNIAGVKRVDNQLEVETK